MEYYAYRKPDFIIKRHKYVNRTYDVSPIINKKGEEVDARGGIPLVNDLAALKKIEGEGKTIWIITQRYFLRNPLVIDNDVQEYIQTTYKKHRKLPSKFIVYSKPGKVS